MSQSERPFDDAPADLREVEALVRSAGEYVVPSDDLRPRVLESVRSRRADVQTRGRLGVLGVAALLMIGAGSLGAARLGERLDAGSERVRVAQALAQQDVASRRGIEGVYWGLVEAWQQVRAERAESVRHTRAGDPADSSAIAAQEADAGRSE